MNSPSKHAFMVEIQLVRAVVYLPLSMWNKVVVYIDSNFELQQRRATIAIRHSCYIAQNWG